jgi:hypothetical protein
MTEPDCPQKRAEQVDQSEIGLLEEASESGLNGAQWHTVSRLLGEHRNVHSLARDANLTEPVVKSLLEKHSGQIRLSWVNSPLGEALYIRKDTGLLPKLRELLAIAQLVAK